MRRGSVEQGGSRCRRCGCAKDGQRGNRARGNCAQITGQAGATILAGEQQGAHKAAGQRVGDRHILSVGGSAVGDDDLILQRAAGGCRVGCRQLGNCQRRLGGNRHRDVGAVVVLVCLDRRAADGGGVGVDGCGHVGRNREEQRHGHSFTDCQRAEVADHAVVAGSLRDRLAGGSTDQLQGGREGIDHLHSAGGCGSIVADHQRVGQASAASDRTGSLARLADRQVGG